MPLIQTNKIGKKRIEFHVLDLFCWDFGVHFEARDRQDNIHVCTIVVVMIWWDGHAECWVCYKESATPLDT